jgi:hypothetical protein
MATYQDQQISIVLTAKCKLTNIADNMLNKAKSGDLVDECCITKYLFIQRLVRKVECYTIDGEDNCYSVDEWQTAIGLLNKLLS